MRSFQLLGLVALAIATAAPALAAGEHGVAPAGTCAEPRRFDGSAACTDCPAAEDADDSFAVSGPARGRFSPNDVAAKLPGPAAEAAPPELGDFQGRGPCDTPGSCTGAVAQPPTGGGSPGGNGGVGVVERPPRPGGPPGTK
jgi:hypothetical protein